MSDTRTPASRHWHSLLLGAALAVSGRMVHADTLVVDAVAAAETSADNRPRRGMTMGAVERRWGAPVSRAAPVGQPPITRWDYADFTVFFEYQHVVHAVRRQP
jgi:hypothetical protein